MPQCKRLFFNSALVSPDSAFKRINHSYQILLKRLLVTKPSFPEFNTFSRIKSIKSQLNQVLSYRLSTKTDDEVEENKSSSRNSKKKLTFIVPSLSKERITELATVVGICVGRCNISWMKISIPYLSVLDWNVKVLPEDFKLYKEEPSILKLAYDMKRHLPTADLYVMETFSMAGRQLFEKLNHIHLSSMLTVLLNGVDSDTNEKDKVVFQKKFVLNNLYDLVVGAERISTRLIVEDMVFWRSEIKENTAAEKPDIYSSVEILPKFITMYKESNVDQREDLSLVYLLTLSFVDVNIYQNEKSLAKISERKRTKLKIT